MSDYPKDIQKNIEFRVSLWKECEKDSRAQAQVRELCTRDVLWFFNCHLWTFSSWAVEKEVPFVTWGFQDEFILWLNECIEAGENVFVDKSRDMGATWMVLMVFLWRFLYKRGQIFRIGSRKEEYVDQKGVLDTHFEKFRWELQRLPWYLLPEAWVFQRDGQPYMRIINREMGSVLVGEATNANFARGGRQTAVLFDEFQAWESAEEAWRSASDATRCKIALGTPDGAGNKFAELSRTSEIRYKRRLWWYLHPLKANTTPEYLVERKSLGLLHEDQSGVPPGTYRGVDLKVRSPWYDVQERSRAKDDLASNVDIDYLTSGRPIFDTRICDLKLSRSKEPVSVGDLQWKVSPVFDEVGNCTNRDSLKVEFIPNFNGVWKIWEMPREGFENAYVMGADTAEGLEQGDYDSCYVIGREEGVRVCASLHGHLRIHEYAIELAKGAVFYERAFLNVERNNHGHGVLLELIRIYTRLWHKDIYTKGYAEITDRLGWETTSMSKPVLVGTLGKAISEGTFECPDEGFWKETLTFVEDRGRMEAQGKTSGQKCYDDRIMAMGIALYTHLNSPLPAKKHGKVWGDYSGRRSVGQNTSKVGWVVNA